MGYMIIEKPVRNITVKQCTCQRCFHQWIPRKEINRVRICPECKSVRWDEV